MHTHQPTHSTWSRNGTAAQKLNNHTVKCFFKHIASFAVLLAVDQSPFIVHEIAPADGAINIVNYVGSIVSIVCLLATVICLITFR